MLTRRQILSTAACAALSPAAASPSPAQDNTPVPDPNAPYLCHYSSEPVATGAYPPAKAWDAAPKSRRFVDVVTGMPGHFETRAAALWDESALYVKFWAEDPFPEAHLTRRDSIIFLESDLEVFIDGGDSYYEFEINALGTVYEVFFIWQDAYKKGGFSTQPEFDVLNGKGISFGGNFDRDGVHFWRGKHPRGLRWAFPEWDFPGLRTSVTVDGKLNDRSVVSKGWTLEVAFPWTGMKWLANGRSLPPKEGDTWRLMFARYQKMDVAGNELQPHPAWAWHPIGDQDNHVPERWTPIQFTRKPAS